MSAEPTFVLIDHQLFSATADTVLVRVRGVWAGVDHRDTAFPELLVRAGRRSLRVDPLQAPDLRAPGATLGDWRAAFPVDRTLLEAPGVELLLRFHGLQLPLETGMTSETPAVRAEVTSRMARRPDGSGAPAARRVRVSDRGPAARGGRRVAARLPGRQAASQARPPARRGSTPQALVGFWLGLAAVAALALVVVLEVR